MRLPTDSTFRRALFPCALSLPLYHVRSLYCISLVQRVRTIVPVNDIRPAEDYEFVLNVTLSSGWPRSNTSTCVQIRMSEWQRPAPCTVQGGSARAELSHAVLAIQGKLTRPLLHPATLLFYPTTMHRCVVLFMYFFPLSLNSVDSIPDIILMKALRCRCFSPFNS